MRIVGRAAVAACIVALGLSACVAAPGASPDPSASPSASASPAVSASPSASPAPAVSASPAASPSGIPCPTPLPINPATGAMVTTVEALAALGDAAAACYGTAKLEVIAYVPGDLRAGFVSGYTYAPAWLYSDMQFAFLASSRDPARMAWLDVYVPPSIGACATQDSPDCVLHPYLQSWLGVIGHFNDPASATCTATPFSATDAATPPITPARSEAACRTHFVMDSFWQQKPYGDVPVVNAAMCPVEPITIEQMVAVGATIGDWYGLSCLGDREMTFDAYVVPGVGLLSGREQYPVEPRGLADPLNTGIVLTETRAGAEDAAHWFVARVPPDLAGESGTGSCDGSAVDPASCPFASYVGKYVRITGHYDDYESMTCKVSGGPGGSATPEPAPITPDAVILGCREQFVVDTLAAATGPAPSPSATPPTTSTATYH